MDLMHHTRAPRPRTALLARARTSGATRSSDLQRILALPVRKPLDTRRDAQDRAVDPEVRSLVEAWTAYLKRPEGTQELFPVQAWILAEAYQHQGVIAQAGVGHGKTLPSMLLPMVVPECKTAVLLIPPELREQFDWDWHQHYGPHWNLPNRAGAKWFHPGRPMLHVVAYSELSHKKFTDRLEQIGPDLIIADEVQMLKDRSSVRTSRFLAYLRAHQATRFCGWSGTLTERSLQDFAHLVLMALRERAPVPIHWPTVEEWAEVLDPSDEPRAPGALAAFLGPGETDVRRGYQRRLFSTPGMIYTPGKSVDTPLVIEERRLREAIPDTVQRAMTLLRKEWERPDGKIITEGLERAKCAREMACGFYYRWVFPRGEGVELIAEWMARRKAYAKEVREKLQTRRPHLDSPLLCFEAARRAHEGYVGDLPVWHAQTWAAWVEIRDLVKPSTEPVWIDEFLARDAADWARHHVGIVWYEHDAFGHKVAELGGLPLFEGGPKASRGIRAEDGSRSIVASIKSHHKGKNLQAFSRQLVANPPSAGGIWEQLLGRTHRTHQKADQVLVHLYKHVEEMVRAVDKAHSFATYIEGILGTDQRLLHATGGAARPHLANVEWFA